jgi:hemerythrin-like domain-containing protein
MNKPAQLASVAAGPRPVLVPFYRAPRPFALTGESGRTTTKLGLIEAARALNGCALKHAQKGGSAMHGAESGSRRAFIRTTAATAGSLLFAGCAATSAAKAGQAAPRQAPHAEEEISPAEDLMREHGVLKRVLLVYGEALRRMDAGEVLPPEPLADAAAIIRSFIEDYHEKLEEDFLFPRFRKAGMHVELVDVLTEQHRAGRRLTDTTLKLSNAQAMRSAEQRQALADSARRFIRMYSPHEAREDTVLFPALRKIVTGDEYDDLGEEFEEKEHQLFGEDGFEKMVQRVAAIEKALGIYDLKQFTPRG